MCKIQQTLRLYELVIFRSCNKYILRAINKEKRRIFLKIYITKILLQFLFFNFILEIYSAH